MQSVALKADEVAEPEEGLTNPEVSEIYRKYGYFLHRRSVQILRDRMAAEDALQDAFVKIMRRGGVLRQMDFPLRWLYRVVDRCCLDHLRRHRRSREAEPLADELPDPGPHPGVRAEMHDAVLKVLEQLVEKEQDIALMAFVDGMNQGEIAEIVGWSRPTVNKKIQLIRKRAEELIGGGNE